MALTINQTSPSLSIIDRLNKEREDNDEKLASAKRINSAADDAAGLQIASRLTSQVNQSVQQGINAQDQINLNNVQEGGLAAISDGLQRANELSIQASNPLNDSSAIQNEFDQITEQINTIAGEVLGDSSFLSGLDANDAAASQDAVANALDTINQAAADLGAQSNALTSQVSTYQTTTVNVSASRSRIEDTDFASATSRQQQNDVLVQSAIINKKDEDARKGLLVNQLV